MQEMRHILITSQTITIGQIYHAHPWAVIIPPFFVVFMAIFGMTYFRSRSKHFAEEI
jgi:hypothetical protein